LKSRACGASGWCGRSRLGAMLKSYGARGVSVANLAITVEELKRARTPRAGGSVTVGMPHGLFVEGMGIESAFA
jgi:hypothetical protein